MKSKQPKLRPAPAAEKSNAAGNPLSPAGSSRRRRWFRVVALAVPLANLLLLEVLLRVFGFGYETSFFLKARAHGQEVAVENPQFSRRYFPPGLERTPQPARFPVAKPPGALRIFVLGESAAMGDPEPAFGFARILDVLLRESLPGRRIEVINVAVTAINSHVIRGIARDCAGLQADYWVVYMGNNEVVGPFGAGTVFGDQTPSLAFVRVNLALKTTRLGQLAEAVRHKFTQRPGAPVLWEGMEMFLKQQVRADDPRLATVRAHFEANLQDILRHGQKVGARVLLCSVAANLKDSPPFASAHRRGLTEGARQEWERSFEAGARLEASTNPALALTRYTNAAAIDPDHAELRYRMGRCRLALGDAAAARADLERARDLDTLRFRIDAALDRIISDVARAPGSSRSVVFVDTAAVLATNSPQGIPGREYLHEHVHLNFAGNYLVARALAEQVRVDLGATQRPLPGEAECAARLGFTDYDHLQLMEEMLKRFGQPPFAQQAGHEERDRQTQAAISALAGARRPESFAAIAAVYREAIRRWVDDWTLRERFARYLQETGHLTEAEEQWRGVVALLPHSELGYFGLANVVDQLGRSREAVALFREALARRPGAIEARHGLGLALANQGDPAGAIAEYQRAVRQKPDFAEARVNLGQTLARLGRNAEAKEQYLAALRVSSNSVAAHVNLGKLLAVEGDSAGALSHYREAVRLKPENAIAQFNLGNALDARGEVADAASHFAEAVRWDPGFVEAHYNLGLALARQNRNTEALPHLAEAARLRPTMTEARFNYGVALAKAGKFADAVREFQETVRLDPGNAQARKFLDQAQALR